MRPREAERKACKQAFGLAVRRGEICGAPGAERGSASRLVK
jgi:hypothetical protein